VWDLESCTCLHTLRGHNKPVQKLGLRGGALYSIAGRKVCTSSADNPDLTPIPFDVVSFNRAFHHFTQTDAEAGVTGDPAEAQL